MTLFSSVVNVWFVTVGASLVLFVLGKNLLTKAPLPTATTKTSKMAIIITTFLKCNLKVMSKNILSDSHKNTEVLQALNNLHCFNKLIVSFTCLFLDYFNVW